MGKSAPSVKMTTKNDLHESTVSHNPSASATLDHDAIDVPIEVIDQRKRRRGIAAWWCDSPWSGLVAWIAFLLALVIIVSLATQLGPWTSKVCGGDQPTHRQ